MRQMRIVAEIILTIAVLIMLWIVFDWAAHTR